MNTDICWQSIPDVAKLIRSKSISPVELVQAHLARIAELNPRTNAFITVMEEQALEGAHIAEREILGGHYRGILHGIPIALKDLFWTKGTKTTAGSKILADFLPQDDSTVGQRLRAAGAVCVGKTHMSEFALAGGGKNAHYGPGRNPWNLEHIAGGSSTGSASAVVAGLCYGAMGSDTGGSIRSPAAYSGAVGLKPTFGRVSRFGVVPVSSTLDHVGPLARTVEDVAAITHAIAGHDDKDSATLPRSVPNYLEKLDHKVEGVVVGVADDSFLDFTHPEVRSAVVEAIGVLERLGCTIKELPLDVLQEASRIGPIISKSEGACYHYEWIRDRFDDYGPWCQEFLAEGREISAVQYLRTLERCREITAKIEEIMQEVEIIVGPTTPIPAPRIDEDSVQVSGSEARFQRLAGFTQPHNVTGQPAISVPCGFTNRGLPIGLQIAGRWWDEQTVLNVAYALQLETEWHKHRPDLDRMRES